MPKNSAIIVCDHGLGHVRRCALMAKEREKRGERVTIFAPRAAVKKVQIAIPATAKLSIIDFETHTTPQRIRRGLPEATEWLDRLPNLDDFQTVICDNLPEILARRPDAVVSAQFFWHDVIEGAAENYAEFCEELLAQHKPAVVGCALFSMNAVRRQPGFKPVGLYKNPDLIAAIEKTSPARRADLLVTGGTTPAARKQLNEVIDNLIKTGPSPYNRVHVDSDLIPSDAPSWMIVAQFSVEMYCQIKAAICRPGLGVLTDLITVGAEIFPVYEEGNMEMKNNAASLSMITASITGVK